MLPKLVNQCKYNESIAESKQMPQAIRDNYISMHPIYGKELIYNNVVVSCLGKLDPSASFLAKIEVLGFNCVF